MDRWNASEYRKHSQNQYRWGVELAHAAGIKEGDNVLDIGCGDGKITAEIAKLAVCGRVVGADSSGKMISLAKKVFPSASFPTMSFVRVDARKMRFDRGFDLVFSNACLHWIHEQDMVLKRVKEAMNPGARIFFQMGGKGNAGMMNIIMDRMTRLDGWKKYFKAFAFPYFFPSPAQYTKLLEQNGLKPVKVFLLPKIAEHKGPEGLFAWIKTTWLPYTHRVPAGRRNEFINHAVNDYLKATKQVKKALIRMPMMRLQVEAVNP